MAGLRNIFDAQNPHLLTQEQVDLGAAAGMNPLMQGYQSGRLSNEANYQLSQQMALREANNEAAALALQPKINALRQRASIYAPSVQKVEDINGIGSGLTWLGGQVGQGAASMQDPMLASAALTGVGTGLSFMPNPIAKGAGFLLRNVAAPGAAYGINREQLKGEQYGNLSEDPAVMANHTPQEIASQVGDYATIAGVADTMLPGMVGRQLGGGALRGAVSKFSPAAKAGMGLVGEGATEAYQDALAKHYHSGLNPNRDTSGDMSDLINSFAGGMAGAGGPVMAGGAADAGFRGIRRGAEGVGQVGKVVTDAAGKTVDMLAPKAEPYISKAAEGLRQAKEMATGKVVDLKGQLQQMSQNRAEAHAEDELIAGEPPKGMDLQSEDFRKWVTESHPQRVEAIVNRLGRLQDAGDQTAGQLLERIGQSDEAAIEDGAAHALKQGRIEEVLADYGGKAGGLAASTGRFLKGAATKVAGAVKAGFQKGRKLNAQDPAEQSAWTGDEYERRKGEAVASLGDLMATHMSQEAQAAPAVQGLPEAKRQNLSRAAAEMARQLADIAHNWTPPGTKKPSVQQFDRMQNDLSRIARHMVSIYGERAPDVAERLQSFADPKTKAVFGHLQDAISKDSVSRGSVTETKAWQVLKNSIPTEKQAELARDGIDLTAPDVRRGMMAMIEAAANGQLTPQARRQLSGLIGADGLQKVVEAYHPVPDAAKRLDEAWSTAEEGPEDKTPTTSDEDTTSNEGSDFEKRQGEKALAKRGNERVYKFRTIPTPVSDTSLGGIQHDPMTFKGSHRPTLYDLRTTAQQDPDASKDALQARADVLKEETSKLHKHLGVSEDPNEASTGDSGWSIGPRSALDELAGRMGMDASKALSGLHSAGGKIDARFSEAVLRQYRAHMLDLAKRFDNPADGVTEETKAQAERHRAQADLVSRVLSDRKAMKQWAASDAELMERAAKSARARVEAGLEVEPLEKVLEDQKKDRTLGTRAGERLSALMMATDFLASHGVIVAERTTQRDIERITPAQVTELVNSGRALLKAHPDTLAADKEWDHERMGSQKNDVLRFRSATRVDSNGDPVLMPVRGRDLAALGRRARLQQGDERDGGNANARYLEDLASGIAALIDTGLVKGLPEGFEGGQIPKALPLDNTSFENFKFGRKTAAENAAARLAEYGDPYLGEGEDFRANDEYRAKVAGEQSKDYFSPGDNDEADTHVNASGEDLADENRLSHADRREMYMRDPETGKPRRREFGDKKIGDATTAEGDLPGGSKYRGVYDQQDRYGKEASLAERHADENPKKVKLTAEADKDEQTSHGISTRAMGSTAYSRDELRADKAVLDAESTAALHKHNAKQYEEYGKELENIKAMKRSPGDKAIARREARERLIQSLVRVRNNERATESTLADWNSRRSGEQKTEFRPDEEETQRKLSEAQQQRDAAERHYTLAKAALEGSSLPEEAKAEVRKDLNRAHRVATEIQHAAAKELNRQLALPERPSGLSSGGESMSFAEASKSFNDKQKFDALLASGKWKPLVEGKPELKDRFEAAALKRREELSTPKLQLNFQQRRALKVLSEMQGLDKAAAERRKTEATKPAAAKEDAAPLGKSQDRRSGAGRKLNAQALQHHAESGNLGFGAAHNSPHRFPSFNWREHLGKGEGHWVFGAGTYMSTAENVHRYYKAMFTADTKGSNAAVEQAQDRLSEAIMDLANTEQRIKLDGEFSAAMMTAAGVRTETFKTRAEAEAAVADHIKSIEERLKELRRKLAAGEGNLDYIRNEAIPYSMRSLEEARKSEVEDLNDLLAEYKQEVADAEAALAAARKKVPFGAGKSPTYHLSVEIDRARLLNWDQPLSEQGKTIQLRALKAIKDNGVEGDLKLTGEDLYRELTQKLGSMPKASEYLQSLGILGHEYAASAGRDKANPNYVIYDDSKIKINYVAFNGQNPSSNASTQAQMEEAKAYLNKILPDVHVAFKEIFGDDGTPVSGEWVKSQNTVFVSTMAGANTLSVAYHEGLHAFFSKFVENDERTKQILMSLADDKKVLARLEALLAQHPAALDQLVDGEERLAYIYQFWAAGMLELPRQPRTVFEKIKRFFARVFAQITDQDRAVAILDALHTGKLGDPSVAGQVIAKAKMEGMLTTQLARKVDALVAKVQSLTVAANSMLEMSDSETARKLAMMMWTNPGNEEHGKAEQEGYLNARSAVATQYTNEFKSYLKGLNDTDLKQINEYLQQGTDASTIPFAPHQEAVNKIRALNKRFYRYMTDERGMQLGKFDPDRYFPRVWDASKLVGDGEAFVKMLMTHYKARIGSEENARALLDLLIRNSLGERVLPERMDGVLAPFFASEENRKLAWIEPHHSAEFQTKNLIHTLSTYYHNGARAAEYTHRFGQRGEKLEGMLEDVHKELVEASKKLVARQEFKTQAEADKWRQRRYEQVVKAVGAMEGTLGSDVNSTWRNASVWTTVYQNVRLLPLALFSNLVDPLALVARGGTMSDAYDTFLRGMTQVINNWKDMLSREPKERQADAWERMAEAMGTVDAAMFSHHVADEYSSMYMSTKAKAVNETFFKANGMEAWNRGVRVGATRAAVNFLTRHAKLPDVHSARWLTELGLAPSDLTSDAGGQLILDKNVLAKQKGIPIAQAEVEMEKVHAAVRRWVQGAVITPNAAQRPSWSSDPHYSMFFHLKQFSYSFHQTILKRAVKELEYGNLAPLGSFIWYVPVMMAADITRGLIQGGGQLPAYMKGMTASDWVLRSASRSGLLSVGEIGINAASDLASLGGPAVEQVIDGFSQPIGRTVVDALPASPLVKHLGGR